MVESGVPDLGSLQTSRRRLLGRLLASRACAWTRSDESERVYRTRRGGGLHGAGFGRAAEALGGSAFAVDGARQIARWVSLWPSPATAANRPTDMVSSGMRSHVMAAPVRCSRSPRRVGRRCGGLAVTAAIGRFRRAPALDLANPWQSPICTGSLVTRTNREHQERGAPPAGVLNAAILAPRPVRPDASVRRAISSAVQATPVSGR